MNFHNFNEFKKSVQFNPAQYEYGIKEENRLLVPLQQILKDDSIKPLPDGSLFDFRGERKYIELKSRTCRKDQYESTCIGVGKVNFAKRNCQRFDFYFVFNFTDGLWCWKYNNEHILFESTINGIPHYFIPMKYLNSMFIV